MKKYRIKYILLLFILSPEKGISAELKPGDKAPPLSLIKLENQEYVKSEDYLGKKNLVICFFSSWSKSFNKHFSQLINISEEYDKNTKFLLIAVKEKKPLIKKYITRQGIPFQVAMDKFGKTFKKFHGKSIPLLVVIDKEGIVTYTNDYLQDGFENDLIEKLKLN
tara:strand:- start:1013 stop:1507 length:495 start_codon:yes stop_codon:yes gene_type:complete